MKTPFFISLFLLAFEGFSQKIASIALNESTRGFRREITITPNEYTLDENSITFKKKLSAEDWNELMKICAVIKLQELSKFKFISRKRTKNAAALQATIEVVTAERKYQSPTFDHNNPPKELVALVNKLRNL